MLHAYKAVCRALTCAVLLIVFSAGKVVAQSDPHSADRKALERLELDWLIHEFKLDTTFISGILDEEFMSISAGKVSSKQEELRGIHDSMQQRMKDGHVVDSVYLDDVHIRFSGDVAVVAFQSVTKGRIKDVPFAGRRMRFYDVWVKRDGKWKALASQGTPMK